MGVFMIKKLFLIAFIFMLSLCVYGEEKSMAELNPEFETRLVNALRTHNTEANEFKKNTPPLVLFHFSDVHGDEAELNRYAKFLKKYDKYFDDAICTGDLVAWNAGSGFGHWGRVKGAEKILFVSGNHDFVKDKPYWDWDDRLTKKEMFDTYYSKFIKNWNVTYEEGNTYYYKDYPEKKIRLIGLDCALKDEENEEQLSWFKGALAGAKVRDLSVIVAYHYNPRNAVQIKCNFTDYDHYDEEGSLDDMTEYNKTVDEFINQGGKFIMWLTGHTHWEQFAYNKDFPKQLYYSIDATSIGFCELYSNMSRIMGTRSQDLANAMVVDTTKEELKIIRIGANETSSLVQRNGITINYKTFEVISQF